MDELSTYKMQTKLKSNHDIWIYPCGNQGKQITLKEMEIDMITWRKKETSHFFVLCYRITRFCNIIFLKICQPMIIKNTHKKYPMAID